MRKIVTLTALFSLLSSFTFVAAEPSSTYCKVVAYVIDTKDNVYRPGQKICAGQVIDSFSKVTVACIHTNNRFIVRDKRQLKECEVDSVFPIKMLEKNRARGDDSEKLVQLLSLNGNYLIEKQIVRLCWLPVMGAKSYVVKVIGDQPNDYEYPTQGNSLNIYLLKSKPKISIIIRAYSDVRQINSGIYTFNTAPDNTGYSINKYLDSIGLMSLSQEVKIQLKLAILNEYNLFEQSLLLLELQAKVYSSKYEAYIALGDMQFRNGLIDKAKLSYDKANLIATQNRNEVARNISMLRLNYIQTFFSNSLLDSNPGNLISK